MGGKSYRQLIKDKKKEPNSRNSQQSLTSLKNKFGSISSKGLLSTMHSNNLIPNHKQYSTENPLLSGIGGSVTNKQKQHNGTLGYF